MFCAKCGKELPDNAGFCGNCGNRIEANAGSRASEGGAPSQSKPASAQPSALKLNPIGMAAAIIAVVALVFSLFPWFDISSQMSMVSGAASGLASGVSSLFGGSSSAGGSLDVEDSYAVWSLIGLSDTFKNYASVYSSFGGSKASGAVVLTMLFSWACLILWMLSLVLTIWGAVSAFAKGRLGILRTSSIFMMITVAVFYVFAAAMTSDTGTANAMPLLCLVLSAVSLACSIAARRKA